jgi:perosamine synthetase
MTAMYDAGVETRQFFIPIHKQPFMSGLGPTLDNDFAVSELLGDLGLYLPSGVDLTNTDIEVVADKFEDALARISRSPWQ